MMVIHNKAFLNLKDNVYYVNLTHQKVPFLGEIVLFNVDAIQKATFEEALELLKILEEETILLKGRLKDLQLVI